MAAKCSKNISVVFVLSLNVYQSGCDTLCTVKIDGDWWYNNTQDHIVRNYVDLDRDIWIADLIVLGETQDEPIIIKN